MVPIYPFDPLTDMIKISKDEELCMFYLFSPLVQAWIIVSPLRAFSINLIFRGRKRVNHAARSVLTGFDLLNRLF